MCFSAQASFAAAAGIAILGSLALKKTKSKTIIPFALIPLFFAFQQFLEGIVWLTINTNQILLYHASMYGFLFFAGIFWPLWVPWSLYILETEQLRKKILRNTLIMGALSVTLSCISMFYTGVTAYVMDHHISYQAITHHYLTENWLIQAIETIIYAIATIIPFFVSSVPLTWFAGIAIATGFVVAHIFYYCAFASVWCFFAAIASGAIYYVIDRHNKQI